MMREACHIIHRIIVVAVDRCRLLLFLFSLFPYCTPDSIWPRFLNVRKLARFAYVCKRSLVTVAARDLAALLFVLSRSTALVSGVPPFVPHRQVPYTPSILQVGAVVVLIPYQNALQNTSVPGSSAAGPSPSPHGSPQPQAHWVPGWTDLGYLGIFYVCTTAIRFALVLLLSPKILGLRKMKEYCRGFGGRARPKQVRPPLRWSPGLCLVRGGGQGRFLVRSLVDGAGSYSVAHGAGLLPTELTGMWGWFRLRSPHQGMGSPPAPTPTKQRPVGHAPAS